MKKRLMLLIAIVFIFSILSCGKEEEIVQEQSESEQRSDETDSNNEIADKFIFQYQDVHECISLDGCELEYEKDGVAVYSKYIDDMQYSDYEDFPGSRYILYIRNLCGNLVLFPIIDFQICEDTDTVYVVQEQVEYEAVQKPRKETGGALTDTVYERRECEVLQKLVLSSEENLLPEELADRILAGQMIMDAYQISGDYKADDDESAPLFSDIHFEFEDLCKKSGTMKVGTGLEKQHKCNALKGYASGIEKTTGKKYYVDIEWDDSAGKEIISPCTLPEYDERKDSETFEKCRQAFEQIMQGDWSFVTPIDGLEYMWEMEGGEWSQADVNRDGLPELICQDGSGDRTEHKKPVNLIFAWNGEKVDLIYIDMIDAMEFLFLTDEGQLIYEWSTSGTPKRTQFTQYHFDEKWNLAFEEAIQLFYFWDEDTYNEEEARYYKDQYYSTFGTYGGGLYYQYLRPKTEEELEESNDSYIAKKNISYSQFKEKYYSMTKQEFLENNASFWEEEIQNSLSEENFYDYEIRTDTDGKKFAIINGIREEYHKDLLKGLKRMTRDGWKITFPEQLDGVDVTEFGACAFQNIPLGDYSTSIEISSGIVSIGEHCFENCGLSDIIFREKDSGTLTIGEGAFASNPELWGIYFNDRETILNGAIVNDCAEKVYLCYRKGTEERKDYFKKYALENQVGAVEIPACYIETPIVDYPETTLVLTPEVRNFFYGENGDGDQFCSFEYMDDAPDYGFPDWHAPCGEFCAMAEGKYEITASSELSSSDGRYAPEHMVSYYGREYTWAEGVEGNGIGESISITDSCSYHYNFSESQ
ncbi:MAG: leucine-rich repeat protein [Lachnospiraceae bacterium]|nr:leucine-rich repeat protein [Lachnospiraceae bacterium]